ncbi:MAG: class I SAM-dependent methyltransferase [Actinomycetota bacterium]
MNSQQFTETQQADGTRAGSGPAPSAADPQERQRKVWGAGDYRKIAWLTPALADTLCEAVDVKAGSRVLDVATGTGHVALAAARRFCHTTGVDLIADFLEIGRQRAESEALPVRLVEASAEDLPFEDQSFDFVLSVVGVMFAANQQQAADEMLRVARPGGTIGLINWKPDGYVAELWKTIAKWAPPPPGAQSPALWGKQEHVRQLLGSGTSDISFETGTLTQRFLSPAHHAEFFLSNYGPTLKVAESLEADQRERFARDIEDLAARHNRATDGSAVLDWDYVVVNAKVRYAEGRAKRPARSRHDP